MSCSKVRTTLSTCSVTLIEPDLVEVDIRDDRGVMDLFDRVRPEVVFHMAAQIDVREWVADPALDPGADRITVAARL